jgi:hypothetical protein
MTYTPIRGNGPCSALGLWWPIASGLWLGGMGLGLLPLGAGVLLVASGWCYVPL